MGGTAGAEKVEGVGQGHLVGARIPLAKKVKKLLPKEILVRILCRVQDLAEELHLWSHVCQKDSRVGSPRHNSSSSGSTFLITLVVPEKRASEDYPGQLVGLSQLLDGGQVEEKQNLFDQLR